MKDLINVRLSLTDCSQTNYRDVEGVPKERTFRIFKDQMFWLILFILAFLVIIGYFGFLFFFVILLFLIILVIFGYFWYLWSKPSNHREKVKYYGRTHRGQTEL